tara:strand:- start:203 stop:1141 length:939 start_codon:yes stop_codon:yes gene_type:complete
MNNSLSTKVKKQYAPVLIIAFNRSIHFHKTLSALSKNKLAKQTNLYVVVDGPRNKNDEAAQKLIFNSIKLVNDKFANITIKKNKSNKGLAANIIDSVSNIINENGKIIVLEDDLLTSRGFIKFMNDALEYYEKVKDVWHISGNNIVSNEMKKNDIFLWRFMNCWGWATWKDRWQYFEKDPKSLIKTFDKDMIYRFNLDGVGTFWDQIEKNAQNKLNTWAIFWYATIFKKGGICVSPYFSYIKNIGFDGSGTHFRKSKSGTYIQPLNEFGEFKGIDQITEDFTAFKIMQKAYKKPFLRRIFISLKRILKFFNK